MPTEPTVAESLPRGFAPHRLLALGQLTLMVTTWPLWIPQKFFPQVPLISFAGDLPRPLERGLLGVLIVSLGYMIVFSHSMRRRLAGLMMGLSLFGLICIDQHRMQPWVWQFLVLSFVLTLADDLNAISAWRWLIIGIYAWSGWSKIDVGFCGQHGQILIDQLFKSIGLSDGIRNWPDVNRFRMAAAIPVFELLVAGGLCWSRTRRWAVFGTALIHIGLLLALGPLGLNHRPGVLAWNVFFLVQNGILFLSPTVGRNHRSHTQDGSAIQESTKPNFAAGRSSLGIGAAWTIVVATLLWPLLEPFGLCDHWPAWAVYAATPERVSVLLHEEELAKLPERIRPYLGSPSGIDSWYPLRIDRWSLDALYAPIYPQDRFQIGVALGLVRKFHLDQIRIVVEGPANRWTGKRIIRQYEGLESVEELARSYRCNALPR